MQFAYLWLENEQSFVNAEMNFGSKYVFQFDHISGTLYGQQNKNYIDYFYSLNNHDKNCVNSLTCIVGENGSGKTTLLNFITNIHLRKDEVFNNKYLAVWYDEKLRKGLRVLIVYYRFYLGKNSFSSINKPFGTIFRDQESKIVFELKQMPSNMKLYTILYNNFLTDTIAYDHFVNKSNFYDLRTNYLLNTKKDLSISQMLYYKNEEMNKKVLLCSLINQYKDDNASKDIFSSVLRERKSIQIKINEKLPSLKRSINELKKIIVNSNDINGKNIIKILNDLDKNFNSISNKNIFLSKNNVEFKLLKYFIWPLIKVYISLLIFNVAKVITKAKFAINLNPGFEFSFKSPSAFIDSLFVFLRSISINLYYEFNGEIDRKKVNESIDFFGQFIEKISSYDFDSTFSNNLMQVEVKIDNNFNSLQNLMTLYYKSLIGPNYLEYLNFELRPAFSSGENAYFTFFSRINSVLYDLKQKLDNHKKLNSNIILLLIDEAEIGFHPNWQKQYIYYLIENLNTLMQINNLGLRFQIVLTTNNPILLSDVLPNDLIQINNKREIIKCRTAFGANILDLFSDTFFMRDGLIGSFAKQKIQNIVEDLNRDRPIESINEELNKFTVRNISDPILRNFLLRLIHNKK